MKNSPHGRYLELDSMRGFAALMVVFFHYTMKRPEAQPFFKLGTTGVDLFFIISGFVIFMSLSKVKTGGEFIINRVSRLYPTYWTSVSFTAAVMFLLSIAINNGSYDVSPKQYLANMTMFQFYMGIPDLDGPYWTMIIEMLFYIGILLLFYANMLKHILPIGFILTVLTTAIICLFPNYPTVQKLIISIPLTPYIPLFYAGIVFYKIYTAFKPRFSYYAIIMACFVCQVLLFGYAGRSRAFISQNEYLLMLSIYFMLFTLFVNGKAVFLVNKVTLFLGKISFALYLIHQFISIKFIIPLAINRFHLSFWTASLGIALPTVIILAALITFYVEKPMSKRLKEKLRSVSKIPKVYAGSTN